ncbi:Levanase precursor [compost metagenome]
MFIDRLASGQVGFHQQFACRHEAPLQLDNGRVSLHIFLDSSSVEVFANDGKTVMTDLIFPASGSKELELFAEAGAAKIVSLEVDHLNSIYSNLKVKSL